MVRRDKPSCEAWVSQWGPDAPSRHLRRCNVKGATFKKAVGNRVVALCRVHARKPVESLILPKRMTT